MNILVVGSGGREHALGWMLSQSSKVNRVFTAPGNGGTENNVPIQIDDLDGLADFAIKNECFTIVGPEAPLALGIVDKFRKKNLGIFGPTKAAARLESSKSWAKNFMKKNDIPTASFEIFEDPKDAIQYVDSLNHSIVVKADGLAAGKGVMMCRNKSEAKAAIDSVLVERKFGNSGDKIVIEEWIEGQEASYIALCDGSSALPMASSQDHKRAYDYDVGPNTGGMGAYSPTPIIDDNLAEKIQRKIIEKTISGMKNENSPFGGFLYAGIMIQNSEPYVLEYNVRMGDPECQPIMMRADFDLYDYLVACSEGRLDSMPELSWKSQSAVCVVMAAQGYPGVYPKNDEISGLDNMPDGTVVFHAGTKKENDKIFSNGGRVLGVTSLGDSLDAAVSNAYAAVEKIKWKHRYFRSDVGKKGLGRLE